MRVKLILKVILILIYPLFVVFASVRVSYSEPLLRLIYATIKLPQDPMPERERLNLAILGLKAVTTSDGIEEFKNTGLFNQREIIHMQDVKNLLRVVFLGLYAMLVLYLLSIFILGFKELARVLFYGSIFTTVLISLTILFALLSYETLFVGFHELFFKEGSWRFKDEDMLLRIYPMNFWFVSTIYAGVIGLMICTAGFIAGYFLKSKSN
ncbi:MAG: TIGR01906 family membrane protein [Aquificaceae bacterium]